VTDTNLPARAVRVGPRAVERSKSHASARIQTNFVARVERGVLEELCRRLPDWTTPNQLTAAGLGGAVLAGAAYWASVWRREFVFIACVGVVINWFGDSLDGSMARHRKAERPRFGYFLDHSVDTLSTAIILIGVGASPYAGMNAALFALVGYLLMIIHVLIRNHVTGQMQLTFLYCGPTEMRIVLVFISACAYLLGVRTVNIFNSSYSIYSILLFVAGTTFICLFVVDTMTTARRLQSDESNQPS